MKLISFRRFVVEKISGQVAALRSTGQRLIGITYLRVPLPNAVIVGSGGRASTNFELTLHNFLYNRRVPEQFTLRMVARRQTSAAGALALLTEPEPLLKQHALKALSPLVPQFWAEISEHIALMCVFQIVVEGRFAHTSFTEKHCMRTKVYLRKLVNLPLSLQAKSTTSWANMTRPFHLH